jgi:hypothetical protein
MLWAGRRKTTIDLSLLGRGVPVNELSWHWIAVMCIAPPLGAAAVAYPLWRLGQTIFGSIVGTIVIFGSAIALMMREYAELERLSAGCIELGTPCFPVPSAFMRYAIYACIGLAEVFVLFAWSLRVEKWIRNQAYAPEWR